MSNKNSISKEFLLVQKEGNREVKRKVKYYDFDKLLMESEERKNKT